MFRGYGPIGTCCTEIFPKGFPVSSFPIAQGDMLMKITSKRNILFLFSTVVLLAAGAVLLILHSRPLINPEKTAYFGNYPQETNFFDLLGIQKAQVGKIEFVYQPQGLPEEFEPALSAHWRQQMQRMKKLFRRHWTRIPISCSWRRISIGPRTKIIFRSGICRQSSMQKVGSTTHLLWMYMNGLRLAAG